MEVLSLMKLDMANFNIRQYRPLLQQQAVAYEKSTFDKFMENQRGEKKIFLHQNEIFVFSNASTSGKRRIGRKEHFSKNFFFFVWRQRMEADRGRFSLLLAPVQ